MYYEHGTEWAPLIFRWLPSLLVCHYLIVCHIWPAFLAFISKCFLTGALCLLMGLPPFSSSALLRYGAFISTRLTRWPAVDLDQISLTSVHYYIVLVVVPGDLNTGTCWWCQKLVQSILLYSQFLVERIVLYNCWFIYRDYGYHWCVAIKVLRKLIT